MEEMRAMLDDLMGKHRDVPLKERGKYVKRKRFYDSSICKYYLSGLCPYEEFKKTKNDLGSCPKEHDTECLEEWNKLSEKEKERYGYERDLKRWLDRLLADLEKRKEANLARIRGSQKRVYSQEEQSSLDVMDKQIEELLIEAQIQGEKGDVDAAESLVDQAEGVRKQQNILKSSLDSKSGANITKGLVQTICPVSGLILNDEEARLKDHHSGRNYNAWRRVHEKHAELEDRLRKQRSKSRRSERSRSPLRGERKFIDHSQARDIGKPTHRVKSTSEIHEKEDSSEEEGQVT